MSTRTLTACAAFAIALLYLISVPISSLGDAPQAGASGEAVLRFVDAHRSGMLVASVLNGIGWCALMPVAFAGLRELLRGRARTAATVALVAAAVESALIGVGLIFVALLAWTAPQLAPATASVLNDGFLLATSASAWPTVVCTIALALAWRARDRQARVIPALALLAAALHAITSVAFARSGAFSPSGVAQVAPVAFALLMVGVGVALLHRPSPQTDAQAAIASPLA
jgi:hypothetical protein